ncbi:MAG: class B sortase [Lachnospiraceae bacterium]|nr:class B sortase [Lachnospiraceae bacterium]
MRKKKRMPPDGGGLFDYLFAVKLLLLIPLCSLLAAAVIVTAVQALSEHIQDDPANSSAAANEAQEPSESIIEANANTVTEAAVQTVPNSEDTLTGQTDKEIGTEELLSDRTDMVESITVSPADETVDNDADIGTADNSRPSLQSLHDINPDLTGWLTIPGTQIDFPVMYKAGDNDFYLKHNFDKKADRNGLLVLDKRCDPSGSVNTLIHGHNMKSGAMFAALESYKDPSYYDGHRYIEYETLYGRYMFEIFAIFRSEVFDEDTEDFRYFDYIQIPNKDAYMEYVSGAKGNSLYDTGITAQWGENLITLSTCEYSKTNGRLVIVGREIQ